MKPAPWKTKFDGHLNLLIAPSNLLLKLIEVGTAAAQSRPCVHRQP
jgi:hypothetical protein